MRVLAAISKIVSGFIIIRLIWSYLDPGNGSLLIQIIFGALFSLLFFLKVFWGRVRDIFKPSKKPTDDSLQQ